MKRSFPTCLLILIACILPSCGGEGSSGSSGSEGIPTIEMLSPDSVVVGGPAFTLTVNGNFFTRSTTVDLVINGTAEPEPTTFVSSGRLTVAIPASAITTVGNITIELLNNGSPVSSKPQIFAVTLGNPTITSISPTSVTEGGPGFTLTVNGTNLTPGVGVSWTSNGTGNYSGGISSLTGSSTQITLAVPPQAIVYPGTAEIQIFIYVPNEANIVSNQVPLVVSPALGVSQSVSIGVSGATPNGASSTPMISDDGRFITFASQATNLVTPATTFPQVYVYDDCINAPTANNSGQPLTCTPSASLVSAEPAGNPANPVEPNGPSSDPSLGSRTAVPSGGVPGNNDFAFLSAATNLVVPSTTHQQAYFRNTCYLQVAFSGCSPSNILISANQTGGEPNGPATDVIIAKSGCNLVFASSATDVIAGVTTPNEIYLSECNALQPEFPTFSTTTVVSASTSGMPANQGGSQPAVDGSAANVAFASTSTNLTSGSTGGFQQIYLYATCGSGGSSGCLVGTVMVSVDSSGNALQGDSSNPSLSEDGRFVTYTTQVPQQGGGTLATVYRYDLCDIQMGSTSQPDCTNPPSTTTISIGASGSPVNGSSSSGRSAISADGRFVAFDSNATNLISGGNPAGQVFVRDTCFKSGEVNIVPPPANCVPTTKMVSVSNGVPIGGSQEAISGDGHTLTFVTTINGVQQVVLAYTGF